MLKTLIGITFLICLTAQIGQMANESRNRNSLLAFEKINQFLSEKVQSSDAILNALAIRELKFQSATSGKSKQLINVISSLSIPKSTDDCSLFGDKSINDFKNLLLKLTGEQSIDDLSPADSRIVQIYLDAKQKFELICGEYLAGQCMKIDEMYESTEQTKSLSTLLAHSMLCERSNTFLSRLKQCILPSNSSSGVSSSSSSSIIQRPDIESLDLTMKNTKKLTSLSARKEHKEVDNFLINLLAKSQESLFEEAKLDGSKYMQIHKEFAFEPCESLKNFWLRAHLEFALNVLSSIQDMSRISSYLPKDDKCIEAMRLHLACKMLNKSFNMYNLNYYNKFHRI